MPTCAVAPTAQRRSLQLRVRALGTECTGGLSLVGLLPLRMLGWTGRQGAAAVPASMGSTQLRAVLAARPLASASHVGLPRLGSRWRPMQLAVGPCGRSRSTLAAAAAAQGRARCCVPAPDTAPTAGCWRLAALAASLAAVRLAAGRRLQLLPPLSSARRVACGCAPAGGSGTATSEDAPAGSGIGSKDSNNSGANGANGNGSSSSSASVAARPTAASGAGAGGLLSPSASVTVDLEQVDEVRGSSSGVSGSSSSRAAGPVATGSAGAGASVAPALASTSSSGLWVPGSQVAVAASVGGSGSSMDVAAVAGGFGISVGDLARLVSYAFDHDGCLPPGVTAAALAAALRTAVPGIAGAPLTTSTAAAAPTGSSGDAVAAAAAAPGSDSLSVAAVAAAAAAAAAGIPDPAADGGADAAARAAAFGVNSLPPAHEVTFWELVAEALEDFTVQALLASGVLSLGLSWLEGPAAGSADWVEGVAILGTVALVVAVGAGTGYAKEAKFRQLNALKDDVQVRVIRGGGPPTPLPARQLLAGDLVLVEAGDILQADGLLVAGDEIRLDQSHLTGESDDVIRCAAPLAVAAGGGSSMSQRSLTAQAATPAAPAASVVLSGSKVLDGYGRMIVLAVGPYSQQGSINAMMRGAAAAAAGVRAPAAPAAPAPATSVGPTAGSAAASMDERAAASARASAAAGAPSGGAAGAGGAAAASAAVAAATPADAVSGAMPLDAQTPPKSPKPHRSGSHARGTSHSHSRSQAAHASAHAAAAARAKRKRTTQGARRGHQLVKLGGVAASGAFAAASSVLASVTSLASFDGDLPGVGDAAAKEAAEAEAAVKAAAAEAAEKAAAAAAAAASKQAAADAPARGSGSTGTGLEAAAPLLLSDAAPAAAAPAVAPGSRAPRDKTPLGTMGTMGSVDFPAMSSTPLSTLGSSASATAATTTTDTTVTTTMDEVAASAAAAAGGATAAAVRAAADADATAAAGGRLRAAARALVAGPPAGEAGVAAAPLADGGGGAAAATAAASPPAAATASVAQSDNEGSGLRVETFLMQKLQGLAQAIGAFGVAAAGAVFAVNAAALTAELMSTAGAVAGGGPPLPEAVDIVKSYLDLVITSITILVVAVPEGLPLAVTLALAFSVQRMLADNNLVRQLGACETMGAATTICSDKTGTLTSNNMTVVRLWAGGQHFGVKPLQLGAAGAAGATAAAAIAAGTATAAEAVVGGAAAGGKSVPGSPMPFASFDSVPLSSGGASATGTLAAVGMAPQTAATASSITNSATAAAVAAAAAITGGVAAQLVPLPDMDDSQASLTSVSDAELVGGSGGNSRAAGSGASGSALRGRVVERQETLLAALESVAAEAEALAALGGGSSTADGGAASGAAMAGGGALLSGSSSGDAVDALRLGATARPPPRQLLPGRIRDLLVQGLVLNSTACLKPNPATGGFDRSGSPTECALLELPHRLGWGWGWGLGGSSSGSSSSGAVSAPATATAAAAVPSTAQSAPSTEAAAEGVGRCGCETAAARDAGAPCRTSGKGSGSSSAGTHILQLVPFSSARKRMSVVVDGPVLPDASQLPSFPGGGSSSGGEGGGSGSSNGGYPRNSYTLGSSVGTMQSMEMEDLRRASGSGSGSSKRSGDESGDGADVSTSQNSSNGSSSGAGGPPLSPVRVLTKGAAELVLERCSWVLLPKSDAADAGGSSSETEVRPLSAEQKQRLLASFRGRGGGALRLLALAYRDMLVPLQPPPASPSSTSAEAAATASSGSSSSRQGVVGGAASMGGRSEAGAVRTGVAGGGGEAGSAAAAGAVGATAACAAADTRALKLDPEYLEKDLVLVGLVGLQDPLRPEVPGAVAACTRAGITVRMVTGDNATTAACIAQQAGILPPAADPARLVARGAATAVALVEAATSTSTNTASLALATSASPPSSSAVPPTPLVLEGATFRQLVTSPNYPGSRLPIPGGSGAGGGAAGGPGGGGVAPPAVNREAFLALWPRLRVLARCSPGDKFMLVTAVRQLREEGALEEVVAVTGDGTNDAPALTAADVGFCMASGTPIAKEAADILLLDSSFAPIVAAVAWGRNVYASVTRFLQFQLTANVVAVAVAVGGAVWLRASPLSAVQMLWVNLIMDSLASLALATEAPNESMLRVPPNRPNDPLITPTVMKHIVGQSAFQLAALYGILVALQHYSAYGLSDLEAATAAGGLQAAAAALFGPSATAAASAAASAAGGSAVGTSGLVPADTTLVFNAFVCMQLFNQVNCRRVRDEADVTEGLLAHPLFLGIVGAEAGLQAAIVQWGGDAFSTSPLSPAQWGLCLGLGAGVMAVREGLRRLNV